jgi:uncharacterized membrane protein (UPF0127 family)
MNGLWFVGLLSAAAVLGGCSKQSAAAPGSSSPATSAAAATSAPPTAAGSPFISIPGRATNAQPKLQTIKVWLGAEELNTEMARAPVEVETGMMFRTNMAENEAMIFVLSYEQQAAFWMANCPHPLSVAYINTDGVILEIHPLEPFNTNLVVAAAMNIRFALETPQGWFDRHHVSTGTVVRTESGSLKQTFLERK